MEYIVLIIGLILGCAIFVNFLQNPVYRARIISASGDSYLIGVSWGHTKLFSMQTVFKPEVLYVLHQGFWFEYHSGAMIDKSTSDLLYKTLWLTNNAPQLAQK